MNNFLNRTEKANALINLLNTNLWAKLDDIVHFEYGYETHIDPKVQSTLRLRKSNTARHIRFAPDFLVYNQKTARDFLFEYKVTLTPRYGFKDKQWDFGQIEADALENYLNLIDMGVNVIVVIYCPYHKIPLLFGIPKKEWVYGKRQSPKGSKGSGTDFYNIDLTKLFDFKKDIYRLLALDKNLVQNLLNQNFYSSLKSDNLLQTDHDRNSPYNKSEYKTGFNWNKD